MSLINDMLRDLDRRQQGSRGYYSPGQSSAGGVLTTPRFNPVMVILLLLLMVAGGLISWLLLERTDWMSAPSTDNPVPLAQPFEESPDLVAGPGSTRKPIEGIDEDKPPKTLIAEFNETLATRPTAAGKGAASASVDNGGENRAVLPPGLQSSSVTGRTDSESAAPGIAGNETYLRPPAGNDNGLLAQMLSVPEDSAVTAALPRESVQVKQAARNPREMDKASARRGQSLYRSEGMAAAEAALHGFMAEHSEHYQTRITLVSLLLESARFADAQALLDGDPLTDPASRKLQARIWLADNHAPRAITLLADRPPPVSQDAEYHSLLAIAHQQAGQHAEAMEVYAGLLRQKDDVADWWAGLAISLDRQDRQTSALQAYQRALDMPGLDPQLAVYARARVRNLTL